MRHWQKKRGGFTLIEMMIVVTILAVLAAVAIFSFTKAQRKARLADGRAFLSAVATAQETYRQFNGDFAGGTAFYPTDAAIRGMRGAWVTASAPGEWAALGVRAPSSTYFQYLVMAGSGACDSSGVTLTCDGAAIDPCSSLDATGDWWFAVGRGDQDGDGTFSVLVTSSGLSGETVICNDAE